MADAPKPEAEPPQADIEKESGEEKTPSSPSKGGIKKLVMFAAVLVVQVFLAYFLQRTLLFRSPSSAEAHSIETGQTEHKTEKKSKKSKKSDKEEAKEGEMVLLDEIIVNPAETGGRRFLR
jgi:flagellar basal body-associated protein FliL